MRLLPLLLLVATLAACDTADDRPVDALTFSATVPNAFSQVQTHEGRQLSLSVSRRGLLVSCGPLSFGVTGTDRAGSRSAFSSVAFPELARGPLVPGTYRLEITGSGSLGSMSMQDRFPGFPEPQTIVGEAETAVLTISAVSRDRISGTLAVDGRGGDVQMRAVVRFTNRDVDDTSVGCS